MVKDSSRTPFIYCRQNVCQKDVKAVTPQPFYTDFIIQLFQVKDVHLDWFRLLGLTASAT